MVYVQCFIQTTIILIVYSMFYVQCEKHSESDNDFNDITEPTLFNPQLVRMKKGIEHPSDSHVDIEHIEQQHNLETLKDHLNNLNKINYDNNNNKIVTNHDELNLLQALSNHNDKSNEQSTTYTFIEMIVQRTVNKYMNVIRTKSDWLKRLLQLVKEERDIRSRYNCFTDACIYKIQLFTTQLKAHLLRNTVHLEPIQHKDPRNIDLHLKRMKRSISEPSAFSKSLSMNDSTIEILKNNPEIQDLLFLHDDHDDTEDDALRLPDEVNKLNLIRHRQDDDDDSVTNWTNNNDSKHKSIKFDNPDKIDVARFSQELTGDVLSKHIKSQTVAASISTDITESNPINIVTNVNDHNNNVSSSVISFIPIQQLNVSIDNQSNLLVDNESNLFSDNSVDNEDNNLIEVNHKDHDEELPNSMTEQVSNLLIDESNDQKNTLNDDEKERKQVEDLVNSTVFIEDENNIDTSSFSTTYTEQPTSSSSPTETIEFTTNLPITLNNLLPTPNSIDFMTDELLDQTNTTSLSPSSTSTITTTTATTDDDHSEIYQHSIKPSLNIRAISLTVEETLAIPFGLNKFDGRPYENCTGQYENYCYNAIKCVYISVLETAACYCRTGYTGVRCDMFNLPQTLDILKSFREESIDINSLHQPTAYILHNVIEATARYTVNAVLEERLLSTWEDDAPF
uniref:EGF-like domain-containing protein n=2 Tax=Schistosoma mansoni TaxID=6183 RepID=A0A5K4F1D8_SCHMA